MSPVLGVRLIVSSRETAARAASPLRSGSYLRATCLACVTLAAATPAAAKPPAPGAPGARHTWAPADKHGFGTAHQLDGKAYFTLRQASLSEVYFPDLSTPGFRGLQFAVTDGRRFLDRETVDDDAAHVEPVAPGVSARVEPLPSALGFRQVTQTARWKLTKTWITDPARASVLARVKFESRTGKKLRLYVLADPAPGDDGNDDRGSFAHGRLVAFDDAAASAVAAEPQLRDGSSGYKGAASDPWRDLQADRRLRGYDATQPGNVVQGARTALDGVRKRELTLAIGFGSNAAAASTTADASLARGFGSAAARFVAGWREYLDSLEDPPASVAGMRRLYEQSLMVLAASEDKQERGASIAAPNMPWVWGTLTLEGSETSGPYHLVWPRDFYHVATAQKAAGDDVGANRLLDFLWRVQTPDGSWWQNTRVDGTPHWTSLQLDEVALPVVLAWWLGRTAAADWAHVQKAADFIVDNGPETGQERWENQSGWSPNTIATEIAALICAADIARQNGHPADAVDYEATADEWQRSVESWTATTNGPYSSEPYYLRITNDANPNDGSTYGLGDNFPRPVDEREIVDNSFLGLVLFGVKRWDDPVVRNSLAVGDAQLTADTPSGRIWHRFTFDGYGETASGGDWDIFPTPARQTRGRAWPLLSGERGEYELIAGGRADAELRTIARTANDGLMLPEQVWDVRPPRDEPEGEGTRSATPLAWTHAQFVRLAWSIQDGEPVERPAIVACRYTDDAC
jgi:glucoamylase